LFSWCSRPTFAFKQNNRYIFSRPKLTLYRELVVMPVIQLPCVEFAKR
jgi:hypothetical protein